VADETLIDRAQARIRAEEAALDAKRDAFETFGARVTNLQTDQTPSSVAGTVGAVGSHDSLDESGSDRCRTVRTAFAETVLPHSVVDVDESESLLETLREEFTPEIALALAPTTKTPFTADLKQAVLAGVRSRRSETVAVQEALSREAAALEAAATTVDGVVTWLVEANETPLTDLGFDTLARRHETLADHRDRCADVARSRQQFLSAKTAAGTDAVVRHRRLVPSLYQELPVDYPILATTTSLTETCRSCQRRVRANLVRRV
jgi:hypothetical protein